jgi:predicted RNase H-like HicB family nuclease
MRYTVILVPESDGRIAVSVPAMPGCMSVGRSREEAVANVRAAMAGWLDTEAAAGRQPLSDTPAVIDAGVREALEIIEEMRLAGEVPPDRGYDLELATVEVQHSLVA